jgi:hypothetical protein
MPNQQEIDKGQDVPLSTEESPPPADEHPAAEETANDAECQSEDDFDEDFDDDFEEGLDEDEAESRTSH